LEHPSLKDLPDVKMPSGWFAALVLVSISTAEGQVDDLHKAGTDALRDELQHIIDKHSNFWNVSMSFAIHNDTIDLAVAAGRNDYADPASLLTPNHSIPMGSVTKIFTPVGLLRLAGTGKVALG
jgi:CubicO group peptidase (beta-lactamase class C family)